MKIAYILGIVGSFFSTTALADTTPLAKVLADGGLVVAAPAPAILYIQNKTTLYICITQIEAHRSDQPPQARGGTCARFE